MRLEKKKLKLQHPKNYQMIELMKLNSTQENPARFNYSRL